MLWFHGFPTISPLSPNMIFLLTTCSSSLTPPLSRKSKHLVQGLAQKSPHLLFLLSLTLYNPGRINGSSAHIVLYFYIFILSWRDVIWLCYLISSFICLSSQLDGEHLWNRDQVWFDPGSKVLARTCRARAWEKLLWTFTLTHCYQRTFMCRSYFTC